MYTSKTQVDRKRKYIETQVDPSKNSKISCSRIRALRPMRYRSV